MLARPNINSGDAEADAIRATVEVTEEGQVAPGTWLLAAAVSCPAHLSSALYQPRIVIDVYRHRPGDRYFVRTSASAALDQREQWLGTLKRCCLAVEY